jgi:threonyl-tRNA synthetase
MGVLPVITPQFLKDDFLKKCGALPVENFTVEIGCDDSDYALSSTTSETHASLFASKTRYETELPIRFSEVKEIYNEQVIKTRLLGMLKTPSQLIDFIHSFCSPEQIYDELIYWLQFIDKMVTIMSFRCQWHLYSRGEKSVGTQRQWDQTLDLMRKALDACGLSYVQESHETAFAGPRIEGKLLDLLGRSWSGPELAIDFQIPTRLGLKYSKGLDQKIQPVMLRCSVFGPLERLIALLIEKDAGVLPLWLAPEQVRIIAVGQNQHLYAKELLVALQQVGVKATCDLRSGPGAGALGPRIHEVECAKVPYALVIGDNEEREKVVNVRKCGQKATLLRMKLDVFLQQLRGDPTFSDPMIEKSTIEC